MMKMVATGICVRNATREDAASLSAFAAEVFHLGGRQGADPRDLAHYIGTELTAERFVEVIEDPNAMLFIAVASSEICGYVLVLHSSRHPQIADAPAELKKLYVAPALHGRGVADELMRNALSSLERNGAPAVWLSAFSENPRAIAFYQKWGFRIVGTHTFLVGDDPQSDVLMRRDLPLEGD